MSFFTTVDTELQDLQAAGEAPDWMRSRGYRTLKGNFDNSYFLPGETPRTLYTRLASTAARYLNRPDLESEFFNILWRGWLGPASPILANFGTERGLAISCYSAYCDDNLEAIIDNGAELEYLTAVGGGVANYLGDLRAFGSPIKGGGKADGIFLPLRKLNASIPAISQNGLRRGQMAAYLPIDHPDIKAFIRMRRPEADEDFRFMRTHHGVIVNDAFFDRCKARDPEALELWGMLLQTRMEKGEPYIIFDTAAQRDNPPAYEQLGLRVNGSNLCCLEGSTQVIVKHTNGGGYDYRVISEVLDELVQVWDGIDWVSTVFEYKGKAIHLVKIDYVDGTWVRVTTKHKVPLADGRVKYAEDLVAGNEVLANFGVEYPKGKSPNVISAVTIIEVDHEPVYCCHVPTTGMFALADGRMTGNSEIFLATSPDYSFVCCLSSMNLAKYDEWRDTNAVELAVYFLDAVMSEFIAKTADKKHMRHTRDFAIASRAIGLGVLGWHSYLQAHSIAFDSDEAFELNRAIFTSMTKRADAASYQLGREYGVPDWCKDLNTSAGVMDLRNSHRISLAPTRSNSAICGSVSPSIEPLAMNAGLDDGAKGALVSVNYELADVLESYGHNTELVWQSIAKARGSVQHLRFLTQHERDVFKTAYELDQAVLIKQAAERAQPGWQGQSLNLFYRYDADPKVVSNDHKLAYTLGLKSLYYLKSTNSGSVEATTTTDLTAIAATDSMEECPVCSG